MTANRCGVVSEHTLGKDSNRCTANVRGLEVSVADGSIKANPLVKLAPVQRPFTRTHLHVGTSGMTCSARCPAVCAVD